VRERGIVASQAVLIAVGIDWDRRRQILGVEMANRENQSSWRTFLQGLRERGCPAWSWWWPVNSGVTPQLLLKLGWCGILATPSCGVWSPRGRPNPKKRQKHHPKRSSSDAIFAWSHSTLSKS